MPFETINDFITFMVILLVIGLAKLFITKVLHKYCLEYRSAKLKTNLEKIKFSYSLYRFLYYTVSILIEICILKDEDWIFDLKALGKPLEYIPAKFELCSKITMGFYLIELITMFYEPCKKDFYQMLLHHIVTILLTYISFSVMFMKFGLIILLIHDASDPLLELCKIENHFKNKKAANLIFFLFMVVFIVMRLIIYPMCILLTLFRTLYPKPLCASNVFIFVLLAILQIMHLIWTVIIIQIFIKICKNEPVEDTREAIKTD